MAIVEEGKKTPSRRQYPSVRIRASETNELFYSVSSRETITTLSSISSPFFPSLSSIPFFFGFSCIFQSFFFFFLMFRSPFFFPLSQKSKCSRGEKKDKRDGRGRKNACWKSFHIFQSRVIIVLKCYTFSFFSLFSFYPLIFHLNMKMLI